MPPKKRQDAAPASGEQSQEQLNAQSNEGAAGSDEAGTQNEGQASEGSESAGKEPQTKAKTNTGKTDKAKAEATVKMVKVKPKFSMVMKSFRNLVGGEETEVTEAEYEELKADPRGLI